MSSEIIGVRPTPLAVAQVGVPNVNIHMYRDSRQLAVLAWPTVRPAALISELFDNSLFTYVFVTAVGRASMLANYGYVHKLGMRQHADLEIHR